MTAIVPGPSAPAAASPCRRSSSDAGMSSRSLLHYEIVRKIGGGGMGVVYEARDTELQRRVAIKLLPQEAADAERRERFRREARTAAALNHPNICTIHQVGEVEVAAELELDGQPVPPGTPFIVMELVEGRTVREVLEERGALPIPELLEVVLQIAEALAEAHGHGIVHRDLKPENVMVALGGRVKILDFGLAMAAPPVDWDSAEETAIETVTAQLTRAGTIVGTVAYMSPEQLLGRRADFRSDLFSFGVLLHELATGNNPFRAEAGSTATLAKILEAAPPPLRQARPEAPLLLERLVHRCLEKRPEDRPAATAELVGELRVLEQAVTAGRADATGVKRGTARPQARPGAWRTLAGRRPWLALAGAAVLATVGLGLWHLLSTRGVLVAEGPRSVAVLPLRNESEEPAEADYLADGISEAVITRLTQVGLRVTPWDTARRYRGSTAPIEQVASELGVEGILLGSFRLEGDRVRTTLSLVEAESGLQSWAEVFEEPFEDLFGLQSRIARRAAESLKGKLTGQEEQVLAAAESRSVDAYDFYLQGAHILQEGTREASDIALEYFGRALELDPELAEAHLGTGAVYSNGYRRGWGGQETLAGAESSYRAALRLKPALLRAHRGLIRVFELQGRPEDCLRQGSEAAHVGRPRDPETLLARADAYSLGGLYDRALPLLRAVVEDDPANAGALWLYLAALVGAGELEQIPPAGERYLRRFGEDVDIHLNIAMAHHAAGDFTRAREHYEATRGEDLGLFAFDVLGLLLERLGERENALQTWRRGLEVLRPGLEAHPDNLPLLTYVAVLYALLGETSSFLEMEQRALALPSADWARAQLAFGHLRLGGPERAVERLGEAIEHSFWSWDLSLRLSGLSPPESPRYRRVLEERDAVHRRFTELY